MRRAYPRSKAILRRAGDEARGEHEEGLQGANACNIGIALVT